MRSMSCCRTLPSGHGGALSTCSPAWWVKAEENDADSFKQHCGIT